MLNVQVIRNRLSDRPNLVKVISNTGWLFADKILRMGVGVLVGVWVARYLGPADYGLWNYAISFSALLSVLGTLSMDNIVVRDLLQEPSEQHKLLGTCFVLRLLGALLSLLITVVAAWFVRNGDWLTVVLVALSSAGFVFQSLNVIDFYFQSHLKSKLTVYAQNLAFILASIVKVILLLMHAPLIAFACASLMELMLAGLFIVIAFRHDHQSIRGWRFDKQLAKRLLKDSFPLILSGIAIMVYMRLDQVMLGEMIGDEAVGIYSAAIKLTEVWYFMPMSIASSVFPVIIRSKHQDAALYNERLRKMYDFMAMLGIVVAVITTFVAQFVIRLLYGAAYAAAAGVLTVTIWTGVIICLSTIHSRWLLLENLQKYNLHYAVIGAVSNFIANLFLIKSMGIIGAAYGTLIAQFIPMIVVLALNKQVRGNILLMIGSIFSPLRLLAGVIRKYF